MKSSRLEKYETKVKPPITENQHRANCERVADMLLTVAEKMHNPAPVAESFDELMSQLKTDVKRSPVVIHHHTGERIRYDSGNAEIISEGITSDVTLGITSESTLGITGGVTFTDSEKLILEQLTLEQLKNA